MNPFVLRVAVKRQEAEYKLEGSYEFFSVPNVGDVIELLKPGGIDVFKVDYIQHYLIDQESIKSAPNTLGNVDRSPFVFASFVGKESDPVL